MQMGCAWEKNEYIYRPPILHWRLRCNRPVRCILLQRKLSNASLAATVEKELGAHDHLSLELTIDLVGQRRIGNQGTNGWNDPASPGDALCEHE